MPSLFPLCLLKTLATFEPAFTAIESRILIRQKDLSYVMREDVAVGVGRVLLLPIVGLVTSGTSTMVVGGVKRTKQNQSHFFTYKDL